MKISPVFRILFLGPIMLPGSAFAQNATPPNIVIYLADDLGYGSSNPYGAPSDLIKTPALSRLAETGARYTEAYATASVCSPTRYSLLTGRYSWRGRLQHGVVNAHDPLLIERDTETIGEWLQARGYQTAHIGKWHLGYKDTPSGNLLGDLRPGPNEVGFDYHFGVPNNMDDLHKVYVENSRIHGLRSEKLSPYGRSFYGVPYTGYDAPQRNEPEVMNLITDRAVEWLEQRDPNRPFFLYFGAVAVHHPIMPSERMRGTSEAGAYGDFIHDLDDSVGRILEALSRLGQLDNTLFIFTSDNGGDIPEDAGRPENQAQRAGLHINGPLRGDKHSIYEGGLRVPLLVAWPEAVPSGTRDAVVTTADFFATITDIVSNDEPHDGSAPDSISFKGNLFAPTEPGARTEAVFRDVSGRKAIRFGPWKLIDTYFPNRSRHVGGVELYHLEDDPAEAHNLAAEYPRIVSNGYRLLEAIMGSSQPAATD